MQWDGVRVFMRILSHLAFHSILPSSLYLYLSLPTLSPSLPPSNHLSLSLPFLHLHLIISFPLSLSPSLPHSLPPSLSLSPLLSPPLSSHSDSPALLKQVQLYKSVLQADQEQFSCPGGVDISDHHHLFTALLEKVEL